MLLFYFFNGVSVLILNMKYSHFSKSPHPNHIFYVDGEMVKTGSFC